MDCIEREKVIDELDELMNVYQDSGAAREVLTIAKRSIRKISSVNMRPVVRGEWVQVMGKYDWMVKCSRCNGVPLETSNFCPNCGADMRKVT